MASFSSTETEDLSVISAVYNHEATLADTIESVLSQETKYRIHHYLFNDASTDASAEILERYRKKYPDRITVFTNPENLGTGKKSFLHHKPEIGGTYWTLLAGDDFWTTTDKVERQLSLLSENPQAIGCSTHTVMKNEKTGEETHILPELQRWNLVDMIVGKHHLYVHPSSIVWRHVHRDTGYFLPPEYIASERAGDTLLLHVMLFSGGEMINLPDVTSCYRVTGRGVWTSMSASDQVEQNKQLNKYIRAKLPLRYRVTRVLRKTAPSTLIAKALSLPAPLGRAVVE